MALDSVERGSLHTESTSRLKSVQALRGVAAFSVAFFHFGYFTNLRCPDFVRMVARWGYLGVPVFFVISAFILPYSLWKADYRIANFWRFVTKRLVRLEPPYWVCIAVAIAVGVVAAHKGAPPPHVTAQQLLLHAGYLVPFWHRHETFGSGWIIGSCWTLAIEFQFYLTIALLFRFTSRSNVAFWAFLLLTGALSTLVTELIFLPHQWPLFCLGISGFRFFCNIGPRRIAAAAMCACAGWCFFALGIPEATAGCLAITGILFVNYSNKYLAYLGDISYSLYLIHVPIGDRICNFFSARTRGGLGSCLVLAGALLISIVAAHLIFVFVERPSMKAASQIRINPSLNPVPIRMAA